MLEHNDQAHPPPEARSGASLRAERRAVGGRVQRLVVLLLIRFRRPQPKLHARASKPRPAQEPTPPNFSSRRDISAARVLLPSCIQAGAAAQRPRSTPPEARSEARQEQRSELLHLELPALCFAVLLPPSYPGHHRVFTVGRSRHRISVFFSGISTLRSPFSERCFI